jgi:hypothetical protein
MFHLTSTISKPDRLEGFDRPVREAEFLPEAVLMRRATAADSARIRVLAYLDDKRLPAGPFLVAEVTAEVVAAVSLSSGTVLADPFRLTADAVAMLRLRAAQVGATDELAERRPQRTEGSLTHAVA